MCVWRLKGFIPGDAVTTSLYLLTHEDYHLAANLIRYIYLQRLALESFHAEENSALIK